MVALAALGVVVLFHTACGSQLGRVSAVSAGVVTSTDALHTSSWWVFVALIAAGLVLTPVWPLVQGRTDPLQVLGGLVVLLASWMGRAFFDSLPFATPDTSCRLTSCWPLGQQSLLVIAPLLLTGVTMIGCGLAARGLPWRLRIGAPALVWLATAVALAAVWDPVLIPYFQGPPGPPLF
jgi:hypothetical protein